MFKACLSLDIDLTPTTVAVVDNNSVAANVHGRHCVHDVPVNVVPRRNWSSYGEPVMRDPDIRSVQFVVLSEKEYLTCCFTQTVIPPQLITITSAKLTNCSTA